MKTGNGLAATVLFSLLQMGCMQTVVLEHLGTGGGSGNLGGTNGLDGGVGQGGIPGSDGGGGGSGDASTGKIRCPNGVASILSAQRETPKIFIALDRSSSMGLHFGSNGNTRYSVTRDAIEQILQTYGPAVNFGYVEFPAIPADGLCDIGNGCCSSHEVPLVPPGSSLKSITSELEACANQSQVGCVNAEATPTTSALSRLNDAYGRLTDPPNNSNTPNGHRYVLLITDGEPSPICTSGPQATNDCTGAASVISNMLISSMVQVRTFVVGVGDIPGDLTPDKTGNFCLNLMAQAGGGSASPAYYPALIDSQVANDLDTILRGTACHMNISNQQVFDSDVVEVDFNSNNNNSPDIILRDLTNQNGWNFHLTRPANGASPAQFDTTTIDFFGMACQRFIDNAGSSHPPVVKSCSVH